MTTGTATHSATDVVLLDGDLDESTFQRLVSSSTLAWDIETTGLDWRTDQLATVQIRDRGKVVLIRALDAQPQFLRRLIEDPRTRKLFHHAMFDLRFMAAAWNVCPANVACTKVAAKLLRIPHREQSLAPLLDRYLGVRLDKGQQTSNWLDSSLSEAQLLYAARDVWYLQELLECLRQELEAAERWTLVEACFSHLPARVALELEGFDDVFVY